MKSYDYKMRDGVLEISWERFHDMTKTLAERLAGEKIQAIMGIAKAGLFPSAAIACALRLEIFPVRLTRREDDRVVRRKPKWKVDVSEHVKGLSVAVIDEIADTGQTLELAAQRALQKGAAHAITVALVMHSWADPKPDLTALVSDALVIFPWNREVYQGGAWGLHPELSALL
jgi:hypoxanthine phosphoribosyltransferase